MLRFLCKCRSLTQIKIAEKSRSYLFVSLLESQSFGSINVTTCRNSSSTSATEKQSSFTDADLINSRVLIPQIPSNSSNSVLTLLESCGFSQVQIKTVVSRFPKILTLDAERNLKPKIDFFRLIGISEADVANMITTTPHILCRSLKDHLTPTFDFLTTLFEGEHNALCKVKRFPLIFQLNTLKNLEPNLATLRSLGVPESQISHMMCSFGTIRALVGTPNDWFSTAVGAVMKMGFDPSFSSFGTAVCEMAFHQKESNWEGKVGLYRSLGFSDEEILSMFRKQPNLMGLSEENVRGKVKFFFNKFHWSPSKLSARPNVLSYSLEKRIIPRCSVLQLLVSGDRIHKSVSIPSILVLTEKEFSARYVTKYKDEVPEVLDAYQSKLTFDENTFDLGLGDEA